MYFLRASSPRGGCFPNEEVLYRLAMCFASDDRCTVGTADGAAKMSYSELESFNFYNPCLDSYNPHPLVYRVGRLQLGEPESEYLQTLQRISHICEFHQICYWCCYAKHNHIMAEWNDAMNLPLLIIGILMFVAFVGGLTVYEIGWSDGFLLILSLCSLYVSFRIDRR